LHGRVRDPLWKCGGELVIAFSITVGCNHFSRVQDQDEYRRGQVRTVN
jgi:hypothetical protein